MAEIYSLPESVKYVFIGNSHVGSSFVEAPCYDNRVIYLNSSSLLAFLWRLAELERRGSLKHVKAVVFNYDTFGMATSHSSVKEDALREAACAWRHLDLVPDGYKLDAIAPFTWAWHLWTVGDAKYSANKRYVDRPLEERKKMLETQNSGPFFFSRFARETEWILCRAKEICGRVNARLILVATPLVKEHNHRKAEESDCLHDAEALARSLGCEFYDYRDACQDEDFFDTNHLTYSAAKRFTARFYADVILKK